MQKNFTLIFQQVFSDMEGGGPYTQDVSGLFGTSYFVVLALSLVTYTVIQTTVAAYLSLSDETGASPSVTEVWNRAVPSFLPVFLTGILAFLMVMIGLIFCLLPGIYLAIVLLPFPFVIVNERVSVIDAISRCFALVKDNFWMSFGVYLVAYLIVIVSAGAVGLVVSFIGGILSYFSTRQVDTTIGVVTSILNIIQYLFYLVLFIAIGMNYYNLVERKEATGLSRRIDSFGGGGLPDSNENEEF